MFRFLSMVRFHSFFFCFCYVPSDFGLFTNSFSCFFFFFCISFSIPSDPCLLCFRFTNIIFITYHYVSCIMNQSLLIMVINKAIISSGTSHHLVHIYLRSGYSIFDLIMILLSSFLLSPFLPVLLDVSEDWDYFISSFDDHISFCDAKLCILSQPWIHCVNTFTDIISGFLAFAIYFVKCWILYSPSFDTSKGWGW